MYRNFLASLSQQAKASEEEKEAESKKSLQLLIIGSRTGSTDEVKAVLESHRKGTRILTAEHCIEALRDAIESKQELTSHCILDHAEKVFEDKDINKYIDMKKAFVTAVVANFPSIVEKLRKRVSLEEMESYKVIQPVIEEIEKSSSGESQLRRVKDVLEGDEKGARRLREDFSLRALIKAIEFKQEAIGHLIYSYAEKVYEEEIVKNHVEECQIKLLARPELKSLTKRLAAKTAAYESLLCFAFEEGYAALAEGLIAAGCDPRRLLDSAKLRFSEKLLENKQVWMVLLPHWSAEELMESVMVASAFLEGKALVLLEFLEAHGMDFTSCISSSGERVTVDMRIALRFKNYDAVRFLVERGFNVNSCLDSKPFLQHFFIDGRSGRKLVANAVIFEVLKRGANPMQKSSENETTIDICLEGACAWASFYGGFLPIASKFIKVLKLLLLMGFRVSKERLQSVAEDERLKPDLKALWAELMSENCSVPTLQCLCSKEIRMKAGPRFTEFMQGIKVPEKLKDSVLLKDLSGFEEF